MRKVAGRICASALIVALSFVVTKAQQQRGRDSDSSRADLAGAAGGVVTSQDSDGVPKFVWAAGAKPAPAGATHDSAARWHLRQFASALDVTPADVSAADAVGVQTLNSGDLSRLRRAVQPASARRPAAESEPASDRLPRRHNRGFQALEFRVDARV